MDNSLGRKASKLVAVVVTLSNRAWFTPDESISLKHLICFLGSYDKYLVAPRDLDVHIPGFGIKRFDNSYFGSIAAHNRLMLSEILYKAFGDYRFILIYHLDALVFSDQLTAWCNAGFDFIGAPWISHPDAPYAGNPDFEGKVGNGGFSLRKVSSFLKVMKSREYGIHPNEYWDKYFASKGLMQRSLNFPKKILKSLGVRNTVRSELARYPGIQNEEHFWANRASHYLPEFKVPSVETALSFAFECVPRYCFEKNDNQLPFGCHAWPKYDREFWEPHLLK